MDRDRGTDDGREATGGIGPPGSISRRRLLQGAAAAGLALGATQLEAAGAGAATPRVSRGRAVRPRVGWVGRRAPPPVNGLHLQFGADASNEVVVTWQTYAPVQSPQAGWPGIRRRSRRRWSLPSSACASWFPPIEGKYWTLLSGCYSSGQSCPVAPRYGGLRRFATGSGRRAEARGRGSRPPCARLARPLRRSRHGPSAPRGRRRRR